MKLRRVLPVVLFFAIGVPLHGQAPSQLEVNSLLTRASSALDHYQQLAPGIHCENVGEPKFRDACTAATQTLIERVEEAKSQIALYRQQSKPQPADLFEAYEKFRRVLAVLEDVSYVDPDSYGDHNKQLFAEAYNSFVKVDIWFEGVVEANIQNNAKCPDR